jgi:hypothetical protein
MIRITLHTGNGSPLSRKVGISADESGDRAVIESAFRALNAAPTRKAVAALFTSDADPGDIDRIFRTHKDLIEAARGSAATAHGEEYVQEAVRLAAALADVAGGRQHGEPKLAPAGVFRF